MEYTGNRNLEERTFQFAKAVSFCVRKLERTIASVEYIRQVIRSAHPSARITLKRMRRTAQIWMRWRKNG